MSDAEFARVSAILRSAASAHTSGFSPRIDDCLRLAAEGDYLVNGPLPAHIPIGLVPGEMRDALKRRRLELSLSAACGRMLRLPGGAK